MRSLRRKKKVRILPEEEKIKGEEGGGKEGPLRKKGEGRARKKMDRGGHYRKSWTKGQVAIGGRIRRALRTLPEKD
jgi:ribosomal protein L4